MGILIVCNQLGMFTELAATGTHVYPLIPRRSPGSTNTFKDIYPVWLETESVLLHNFG